MRVLEKSLAAVCTVLFIFSGVVSLLLFNIEQKAFSSTTYKQAFEDQRLYERMPALLAAAVTASLAENQNANATPFLQVLTIEDWQTAISTLLPPEDLKGLADSALDATFEYVNGNTNSAVLTLIPLKAQLAGESGFTVVRQFLARQPACTTEQLTQMALGLLGGEIALCNPPEELMGFMAPFIQSQLQSMTLMIPDEITFISGATSGTPDDPRLKLHMVRSAIRFSPFFVVLLLLAIAVFAVRSIRDWFVWWGWPLMITGAITAFFALIGSPVVSGLLRFLIQTQGAIFLPPMLATSIAETASAVASQMLLPVTFQGIILAFIGLIMVAVGFFLTRRETIHIYRADL